MCLLVKNTMGAAFARKILARHPTLRLEAGGSEWAFPRSGWPIQSGVVDQQFG
jgi:hypothetical protein